MHPSAVSESVIVLCVRSPFRDAMNPTPHASRSSRICERSTAPPWYGARAIAAGTTVPARGAAEGAATTAERNLPC